MAFLSPDDELLLRTGAASVRLLVRRLRQGTGDDEVYVIVLGEPDGLWRVAGRFSVDNWGTITDPFLRKLLRGAGLELVEELPADGAIVRLEREEGKSFISVLR